MLVCVVERATKNFSTIHANYCHIYKTWSFQQIYQILTLLSILWAATADDFDMNPNLNKNMGDREKKKKL